MRLYQRKNSPYWQYSFTFNGHRYRGSTQCEKKGEAQRIAAKILAEIEQKTSYDGVWNISNILAVYYQEHAINLKAPEFIWQKILIFERFMDLNIPINQLTAAHLTKYRAQRMGNKVKPVTINRDFSVLRAAINYCHDVHHQPKPNISWKRIKVSENEARVRFLSRDEYHQLIAAADPDLQRIILAAVMTGLRKTTLTNLRWHQVDLNARTITSPKNKSGKPHILRIADPLFIELQAITNQSGLVFNNTNFRKRWEKARRQSGLVDFRFHDLRHTFGSWARQAGVDLLDICEAMDHSDVTVTQRYAHIDPINRRTAFDAAGEKLAHFWHTDSKSKAK